MSGVAGEDVQGHHATCECVLCLTVRSDQAIRHAMNLLAEGAMRRVEAYRRHIGRERQSSE